MAKFAKGQSGNPNGRPKGTVKHAELKEAIEKYAMPLLKVLIEEAITNRDTKAAMYLLDKILPNAKQLDDVSHETIKNVFKVEFANGN
jgi:hypothetical protein